MIIAYYRKDNGEIRLVHQMPDSWSMDEARKQAAIYNRRVQGETAEVEEVADNSLTAYLFNKLTMKEYRDKDDLRLIIYDLESVLDKLKGWGE
jgi:hypothetical protein